MNILIGGAWPYANGSLHIGQIAALLPGDVLARYHRLKGDKVCFVSGTDAHGTPVALRAKKEGRNPKDISDAYHKEFTESFNYLGFSYDYYGVTSSEAHKQFVRSFHEKLYDSPYVYEHSAPQTYCEECKKVLVDRLVLGVCPVCKNPSRGDQCDHCGTVYQPEELEERTCAICGSEPIFQESTHLQIRLKALKNHLEKLYKDKDWRENAILFTKRYIEEGLRDRALTRDLDWGIEVPKEGYEEKSIYIWAENVLGYLSSALEAFKGDGDAFKTFWNDSKHYYVHGKDNIPFHTIILPALLIAHGGDWHLPDVIVSSEYLTLEGRKISTSGNWGIWIPDLIDKYQADTIRYYLLSNGPEKRDSDFSWYAFKKAINSELLGGYGNFINRTLAFIHKQYKGIIPKGIIELQIEEEIKNTFEIVGVLIEGGELKKAIFQIFELVRYSNKYFDEQRPWVTIKEDKERCSQTLYNCVQLIGNLAVLLEPFVPFSSNKVFGWLQIEAHWAISSIASGIQIPETQILFNRLD